MKLGQILGQYLSNCSIHGMRYLVNDGNRHFTERLFWAFFCVISWCGCGKMIFTALYSFTNNPVAITLDTLYLYWKTPFPALSVCSSGSDESLDYGLNTLKKFHRPLQKGQALNLFKESQFGYVNLRKSNKLVGSDVLTDIYDKGKAKCTDLFGNCKWNDEHFDCCEKFIATQTPIGLCYVFNSLLLPYGNENFPQYFVDSKIRSGFLSVNFTSQVHPIGKQRFITVYIINNYEIPNIITGSDKQLIFSDDTARILVEFDVEDIYNEPGVTSVPMEKRNCRFSSENQRNLTLYPLYSYDSCVTEIQMLLMHQLCGCVSHLYPRMERFRVCNLTELMCVLKNRDEILKPHADSCLSLCEGTLIRQQSTPVLTDKDTDVSGIDVKLMSLPTIRYKRYILVDYIDIIVEIGSSIGLLMGASILSIFEIPYWCLIRRNQEI